MENTKYSSLPGPLWPGVVTLDRALSINRIEVNCVLMLNRISWNGTVFVNTPLNIKTVLFQQFSLAYKKLSSSSSCCTISTDLPDPLPLPYSIVHRFRQVLKVKSRICTELLYVGSSWSSCLCSSMWRGPLEYACLVRLTWIVLVMASKGPYSCCFIGCYLQDLFNIARSILV